MTHQDIVRLRLYSQHISRDHFKKPEDVVQWLGAVQAQDYQGAKWSIGLRITGLNEADVEKAISNKSIIRTWPMRGTLHFIAADDARWMLRLLTPRIISGMSGRNRQLELDEKILAKSRDILLKNMEGGKQLMRSEVYDILEKNGIATTGQRGIHVINYLAQTQLLCHGFHNEKQPTYVLLDDWIPNSKSIDGEEALAEIAYRYFTSHGPATLQDFVWWTGLKLSDARTGLNANISRLVKYEINGATFWSAPDLPDKVPSKTVHLLPGFDEFMLGYTDRTLMVDKKEYPKIVPGNNGMFMPTIVINGKVEGLWKRTFKKDKVQINIIPFGKLSKENLHKIAIAAKRFGKYLGREIILP
jgi:hypothetical protein